jgi:phosphopentomutase
VSGPELKPMTLRVSLSVSLAISGTGFYPPPPMKRALLVVLDSVGCGHAPDAEDYGDAGADTLGHLLERIPDLTLPHLGSLGLGRLLGLRHSDSEPLLPGAAWSRLTAQSAGKDTTTGHWELMGCVLENPFATFESFPPDLVKEIESRCGVRFIGNVPASGTEILYRLGEQHLRTGNPILYTSADSVLQIAAHEEAFGIERLWDLCKTARQILDQRGIRIGRVIARPFTGNSAADFKRTANRHDYSLTPPETALNRLQQSGVRTIGVGKISDIFAGAGLDASHPTASNADGMAAIEALWSSPPTQAHFIFANLVDFDSLYGHRRDPEGYAQCLREFDSWLGGFLNGVQTDDLLLITADHGNDPYQSGTDHTREQVPLLTLGLDSLPKDGAFSDVANLIEDHFR